MIYEIWCDAMWYDIIWYMLWYMMWCDIYDIWCDVMWHDYIWCDMIYDVMRWDMIRYMMWCDVIYMIYIIYDVMWCDMIWYDMIYDILFNCNWVDTRWQQYSTHLHINSTQNNTVKQNTQNRTYIIIRILKLAKEYVNVTVSIHNLQN